MMPSGRDRLRWGGVMRFEDAAVDGRNAQEAGLVAGRIGEWDKSTPLLPFTFAPVRQDAIAARARSRDDNRSAQSLGRSASA